MSWELCCAKGFEVAKKLRKFSEGKCSSVGTSTSLAPAQQGNAPDRCTEELHADFDRELRAVKHVPHEANSTGTEPDSHFAGLFDADGTLSVKRQ